MGCARKILIKSGRLLPTFTLIFAVFASNLSFEPYADESERTRFLKDFGTVGKISEKLVFDNKNFSARQRFASFKAGYFVVDETVDKTGTVDYSTSFNINGDKATLYYTNEKNNVVKTDISKGGKLPKASSLYLEIGSTHVYLGQADQYLKTNDELYIKQKNSHPIQLTKKEGFYNIKLTYPKLKNAINIKWAVISRESLLNFESLTQQKLFKNYDFISRNSIVFDGYMFKSSSKIENSYFVIPSPYMAKSFLTDSGSNLGDILAQVFLKIAALNINEEGYFPVKFESEWLKKDYGIGAPYFDNRWNSDLAIVLMMAHDRYGDDEYKKAYERLLSYFSQHIDNYSEKTANGGLLNYDYAQKGNSVRVHTSLNHQLNVINMLYTAYSKDGDESSQYYADKLLLGIESIGSNWVMEDGELHYAVTPNGNMGMKDYDLLTYNDLIKTQDLLTKTKGAPSPVLADIAAKKFEWVKNKGYGHIYD